jgi:hypothetical protein
MPLDAFLTFLHSGRRWAGLPSGLLHMAQLDHINWRKGVIDRVTAIALQPPGSSPRPPPRIPENGHHDCALGRWYYGPGQGFAGQRAFDNLEPVHRELHRTAHRLEEKALAGIPLGDLVGDMRELTEYSIQVIALLQQLQNSALMSRDVAAA